VGFPVGVAASLFAGDLIRVVLGGDWLLAVPLIQVLGVAAAVDQLGFNWTAFARARGDTRIMAVQSALVLVAVLGVGVPLLVVYGLPGYAGGLAAGTLVSLAVRLFYLARLFPTFRLVNHVVGAVVPTFIATAVVLLARRMISGQGGARALAEAAIYLVIVVVMTLATERALLKESFGYLRRAVRTAPTS
jgi:O-antigen/teichoic acid export membrane protein